MPSTANPSLGQPPAHVQGSCANQGGACRQCCCHRCCCQRSCCRHVAVVPLALQHPAPLLCLQPRWCQQTLAGYRQDERHPGGCHPRHDGQGCGRGGPAPAGLCCHSRGGFGTCAAPLSLIPMWRLVHALLLDHAGPRHAGAGGQHGGPRAGPAARLCGGHGELGVMGRTSHCGHPAVAAAVDASLH